MRVRLMGEDVDDDIPSPPLDLLARLRYSKGILMGTSLVFMLLCFVVSVEKEFSCWLTTTGGLGRRACWLAKVHLVSSSQEKEKKEEKIFGQNFDNVFP